MQCEEADTQVHHACCNHFTLWHDSGHLTDTHMEMKEV